MVLIYSKLFFHFDFQTLTNAKVPITRVHMLVITPWAVLYVHVHLGTSLSMMITRAQVTTRKIC